MPPEITEAQVRAALQTRPPEMAIDADLDVVAVMRAGRRLHRTRVATLGGLALTGIVAVALLATSVLGGPTRTSGTTPADQQDTSPLSAADRHAALVTWADCLRSAEIPGVSVIGPTEGSDQIDYRDTNGTPLPKTFRDANGEWGSATEACAQKVPALLPELEDQWGDLHSGPAREAGELAAYNKCLADHDLGSADTTDTAAAAAAGCVYSPYDPDAAKVLQCPDGQHQSGLHGIYDHGPWVPTIQAAGQAWLDRQQDSDEFSRTILDPDDQGKHSILHALSRDGRTTAVVYLLTNTYKGWRLQGENLCE
jgi:hypothetical protein